jgi:hypothetical protein
MYFMPCPKPTINKKPRKSINQGREAQTAKKENGKSIIVDECEAATCSNA